jgi:hypothetical protein
MTDNRAFREYATRVSFNMTLSRNQIYALRCILVEIEYTHLSRDLVWDKRHEIERENKAVGASDNYVMGARALERMGLVGHDPGWLAENARLEAAKAAGERFPSWKHKGPSWQLTEAGTHVVALLRIAGLIHMPEAAANTNKRERRRA